MGNRDKVSVDIGIIARVKNICHTSDVTLVAHANKTLVGPVCKVGDQSREQLVDTHTILIRSAIPIDEYVFVIGF